jgi:ABC-2 type transport system permease protein
VILFLYALLTLYIYPSISGSTSAILEYINSLPEVLKAAFGYGDAEIIALTPDIFVTMEFAVLWPLLIGVYAIFSGISVARESERGTLDLLVAQPLRRYQVIISKFAVFILGAVVIAAASLLGLMAGAALINEPVNIASISLILAEALLFVLAVGGYTLLLAAVFLEPRKSLLLAGVITAAMYIINFMVPILNPAVEWIKNISLFSYYQPQQIINTGSLDGTAVAVYSGVAVLTFVVAVLIFQRRDIA